MYISVKYLVLYVGAGLATGVFSKGDKTICWIGVGIAALLGANFGIGYAALSAVEFAIGLGIAALVTRKRGSERSSDPG